MEAYGIDADKALQLQRAALGRATPLPVGAVLDRSVSPARLQPYGTWAFTKVPGIRLQDTGLFRGGLGLSLWMRFEDDGLRSRVEIVSEPAEKSGAKAATETVPNLETDFSRLPMPISVLAKISSEVLAKDAAIKLPVLESESVSESAKAKITISKGAVTGSVAYALDGKVITFSDDAQPQLEETNESLIEKLRKRVEADPTTRLLIFVEDGVKADKISLALRWGAEAGISNIAFAGRHTGK
jgi:hypothetical protein